MKNKNNISAVILAAGKGVRMRSELPKVLHNLCGKPLVQHVLDNIKNAGVSNVYLVVGYKGEDVISAVASSVKPVWQREQLGTGHAVLQAEAYLEGFSGPVIVACGDAPLISTASFKELLSTLETDDKIKASVLTMSVNDPKGYGRVVKNNNGEFVEIVEEKDASLEVKKITEVNTGTYVFDCEYLLEGLHNIGNDNAQKEYYLPDVLKYIVRKNFKVMTCKLNDPIEGSGVNSPEELQRLETYLNNSGKGKI